MCVKMTVILHVIREMHNYIHVKLVTGDISSERVKEILKWQTQDWENKFQILKGGDHERTTILLKRMNGK